MSEITRDEFDRKDVCLAIRHCAGGRYQESVQKLFDLYADQLEQRVAELEATAVYLYNCGYSQGHHDTVEGNYIDIHQIDMREIHNEEVQEILDADN